MAESTTQGALFSGTVLRMGIRYLAISIDQQDYDHLRVGVCDTCGEQPQLRERDYVDEERRDTLDLDKSWGFYQRVLASEPPRPAAALVHGDVTHTSYGWRSYRGLIDSEEVTRVADDLASVTPELVLTRLLVHPRYGDGARAQQDVEYVSHFLPAAQEFTRRVADEGRAIVYYIG